MHRTLYLTVFALIGLKSTMVAQITTILKPGSAIGKDAWVSSHPSYAASNYGTNPDVAAISWTAGGSSFVSRTYLEFDLSTIPANATISSAAMTLYHNPTSGHWQGHQNANACYLRRVSAAWDELAITWNNQPSFSMNSPVNIPQSASSTQNYPNIDVSTDVQDMVANPSTNFGWVLMLQTEQTLRSVVCSSSDHADSTRWPELVIVWDTIATPDSVTCVTLTPDAAAGKDAWVTSYPGSENTNYGSNQDIAAVAWTASGNSFASRSYFDFDLSFIPSAASITSAELSLFYNPTSGHSQGHQSTTGPNTCELNRVTSTWDETLITWNNQPSVTTVNQAIVPQSSTSSQNYPNLNVLGLITDMFLNPQTSFGFQLKLQSEAQFRSMVFASSDNTNPALHPSLNVCYVTPVTINELSVPFAGIRVHEHPVTGNTLKFSWILPSEQDIDLQLTDLGGRIIWRSGSFHSGIEGEELINLSEAGIGAGMYLISLQSGDFYDVKRVLVRN